MSTEYIFYVDYNINEKDSFYRIEDKKQKIDPLQVKYFVTKIIKKYRVMFNQGIYYIKRNNILMQHIETRENNTIEVSIKQYSLNDDKLTKQIMNELQAEAKHNYDRLQRNLITSYNSFDVTALQQSEQFIFFNNSKINLHSGEITSINDLDIGFMQIPYNIDETCEKNTPKLDKVINAYFPNYNLDVIKDLLTYLLLADNPSKAFFIFIGRGNSGKTSFMQKVITRLISKNNYFKATFNRFIDPKDKFYANNFANKICIWCDEAGREEISTNVIKELSSGAGTDFTIEFKGLNGNRSVKRYFKPILTTNYLPYINVDDDAFYDRIFIYDFEANFNKQNDNEWQQLIEEAEFESFINHYAIPRLKEWTKGVILKGQNYSIAEKKTQYMMRANPYITAIKTDFEYDEHSKVAFKDMIAYLEKNYTAIRNINTTLNKFDNSKKHIREAFLNLGYDLDHIEVENKANTKGRYLLYKLKPKSNKSIDYFKTLSNDDEWTKKHYGKIGQDVLLNANETQLNTTTYNDIRNYFKTSSDATILRSVLITEFKQHSTKDIDLVLSTLLSQGEIIEHKLYEYKINLLRGGTQK
jgi:phage/plasmid-associated DNA primase